jgi:hypothetical protein
MALADRTVARAGRGAIAGGQPISPGVIQDEVADMNEEGYGSRGLHPLTEGEIKGVIQREIEDALGGLGSELSEERRKAIQFYYGKPFGNEIEGRSSVVLEDVRDTIEWAMPNLMQMLAEGPLIARYMPKGIDDVRAAEQATEYINHVFQNECRGYELLYEWFKTGLLEKNGFVKAYVETRVEPKIDTYYGLTDAEAELVVSEEGIEVLARDEHMEELGMNPETGQPVQQRLHDLRVRVVREDRRIKVDGIPPEEFLSARRLIDFDDYAPFTAHRKKVTASDLIAMGYDTDMVLNLPSDDTPEYEQARTERLSEDETFPVTTAERADPASREIWLTECIIRIDEDGDGYAELRKITVVGESSITIIDDEEINWNPFAYLCPIPMPHKFYGISMADLVADLQLIRSTLLRQSLDNLYLTNNSRLAVVEGGVNLDDLMVSRPGGLVRVRAPGMVEPLPVQPIGPQAFHMLEFLEGVKENRTGITRYNQGQDAGSLNKTATGVTKIMNASFARLQLVARMYAEVGLKRLFKIMLRAMVEGGFKKRVVRLRGEWVEIDPSTWNADMDIEIDVGLGVGQAAERQQELQTILQMQERMIQAGQGGYLVEPQHVYNAVADYSKTMGVKDPERYFGDPSKKGPPPQKPDPEMVKAQADAQKDQAKLQLEGQKLQKDGAAAAALADFRQNELEEKMDVERAKIALEKELREKELEIEKEKLDVQREAARAAANQPTEEKKETPK